MHLSAVNSFSVLLELYPSILICYIFHFVVWCTFKISLRFLLWPVDYLEVCCIFSQCFGNFPVCYWFLVLFHCDGENTLYGFNWGLFCGSGNGLSLYTFPHLKRMCILLLLHGMLYKCWLGCLGWCAVEFYSILIFCLVVLLVVKEGSEVSNCSCRFACFSF